MKKNFLAIAVGIALTGTAGIASAEVSWYGKADIKLIGGDTGMGVTGADDTLETSGNGSRMGIRASTDLGNGMKGKLWQEWAFNPADGISPGSNGAAGSTNAIVGGGSHVQFGHRDSLLSIAGDFGEIGIGSIAAPSKIIGAGKIDGAMFADTVGDLNSANPSAAFAQPAGQQLRYSNKAGAVSYVLAYGIENGTKGADWTDGALMYSDGPLFVGLGFHQSGDTYIGSFAAGSLVNLAVHYQIDSAKIVFGFQTADDIGSKDSGTSTTGTSIGVAYGMGANTIKAQYNVFDTDSVAGVNPGAKITSVGFDHSFNKDMAIGVHYTTKDPDASNVDSISLFDIRTTLNF